MTCGWRCNASYDKINSLTVFAYEDPAENSMVRDLVEVLPDWIWSD